MRQLKNFIERIVCTSDICVREINTVNLAAEPAMKAAPVYQFSDRLSEFSNLHEADGSFSLDKYLASCEKEILTSALNTFGTAKRAASYLGIDPSTMSRKLTKYNITKTRRYFSAGEAGE